MNLYHACDIAHFYTQSLLRKVHLFESHCPYLLGIRQHSKHERNMLNFSTGKPYSNEMFEIWNNTKSFFTFFVSLYLLLVFGLPTSVTRHQFVF